MTKVPLLSPGIVPFDAPPYEPNAVCAAPGCDQPSGDPHHLWRRSFLAGAYDWVQIPELGIAVGNVLGLCRTHHDQVEGGAAWITLDPEKGFVWTGLLTPPVALEWQPPARQLADDQGSARESVIPPENGGAPVVAPSHDPMICPSCKRPLPQAKIDRPREARRERRTWSVTVPKDERENGAEILDDLLERSREQMHRLGLPYGEEDTVRYFVLAASLGMFVLHADELMGDT